MNLLNLMEEGRAKLGKGEEKRLRCTVGASPTSFAKELYLVSQDNVIKMARQVKVCAPPARGSKRVCCNTSFFLSHWRRVLATDFAGRDAANSRAASWLRAATSGHSWISRSGVCLAQNEGSLSLLPMRLRKKIAP